MIDKLQLGYAYLSRDLLDSSLWQLPPEHFRVAMYLLLKARHSERRHILPDGTTIDRGELVTSMTGIAENCSYYENRTTREMSRKKVLNILNDLENIGFLKRNSHRKGTHLSICNYDLYQDSDNYNSHRKETLREHRGNTEGTLRNTNKNEKNEKKGRRFSEPSVDEVIEYIIERKKMDTSEANRFCDFYASKGWMVGKNKMKDWKAAIRNWEKGKALPENINPLKGYSL